MYAKLFSILVIALTTVWVNPLIASIPNPVLSIPTLPHQYLEKHFQAIQEAFDQRTILFLRGWPFKKWQANKSQEEILQEFDQLNEWRFSAWYVDPKSNVLIARADFMVAQDLLEKELYQKPAYLAFQYNRSDSTYNSSSIILNGFKFLAMDAPNAKTLNRFFILLQNFRATQLVRLSSSEESGTTTNKPYWVNKLQVNAKTKEVMLNIPQPYNPAPYPIRYYSTDNWSGKINLKELLQLIQTVRKTYDPSNDLIACHSTNGAGRTGTFIAGFVLISEIDKQIATGVSKNDIDISIEKTVMQLSLQRPYLVREPQEYITLYRLIDLYMASLK